MTVIIGLTGGIGTGKSTVSRYLAALGAAVIDADKVGHEVIEPGASACQDVLEAFGRGVLDDTGKIDRKKLAQIVFGDTKARDRLNAIMWSRIWEIIARRIDGFRKQDAEAVVVEAFGLIEAGWDKLVDEVWITVASEKAVLERLKQERGMAEADILSRVRSQLPPDERTAHADVLVRNEGRPEDVQADVGKLWRQFRARHHLAD